MKLIDERGDFCGEWNIELGPQHLLMHVGMLQGGRAVSRSRKRTHEPQRDGGVIRGARRQPAARGERGNVITLFFAHRRHGLERAGQRANAEAARVLLHQLEAAGGGACKRRQRGRRARLLKRVRVLHGNDIGFVVELADQTARSRRH